MLKLSGLLIYSLVLKIAHSLWHKPLLSGSISGLFIMPLPPFHTTYSPVYFIASKRGCKTTEKLMPRLFKYVQFGVRPSESKEELS